MNNTKRRKYQNPSKMKTVFSTHLHIWKFPSRICRVKLFIKILNWKKKGKSFIGENLSWGFYGNCFGNMGIECFDSLFAIWQFKFLKNHFVTKKGSVTGSDRSMFFVFFLFSKAYLFQIYLPPKCQNWMISFIVSLPKHSSINLNNFPIISI